MTAATEFAVQHLIQKLQAQQDYVIALRNQAGISAAVTGLIAGVFASFVEGKTSALFSGDFLGLSVLGGLSLLTFSISIACSAMVVVHFSNFTFCFDTKKMLTVMAEQESIEDFYRKYIEDGEWYFTDNEKLIGQAQIKLWFAMVFGFVQILPWVILVGSIE